MRHSVFIYFLLAFLFVSLIGGSVLTTYTQFVAEGPLQEATETFIPKGKTLRKIAKQLHAEGIISSPSVFELGVRASGQASNIKSGEYSIPRYASPKMVMNILTSGNTYIRRLVVPEGLTSEQVIALMNNAKGLIGDVVQIPKNGTLLPDTYHYSYGDTTESMLERMKNAMDRTVEELWADRDKNISVKTPKEAIIMASIIEKETSRNSERAHIASVFYNRIKKGIRLQSDPTVIYAVTDGHVDKMKRVTYKDLKFQSPYNTYVIYGLPRGPISNPGRASIQAVLHPMQTKDLYFVADGTGGHVFAPNYNEHQKNVTNWRQISNGKKTTVKKEEELNEPAIQSPDMG
ncbi:MAG: endolytic transglycosylase MltG [Alphaproteobacteria bacterium]|nr:endolytic transglycosylase MltG [Alphaproteobacteria bacterium]